MVKWYDRWPTHQEVCEHAEKHGLGPEGGGLWLFRYETEFDPEIVRLRGADEKRIAWHAPDLDEDSTESRYWVTLNEAPHLRAVLRCTPCDSDGIPLKFKPEDFLPLTPTDERDGHALAGKFTMNGYVTDAEFEKRYSVVKAKLHPETLKLVESLVARGRLNLRTITRLLEVVSSDFNENDLALEIAYDHLSIDAVTAGKLLAKGMPMHDFIALGELQSLGWLPLVGVVRDFLKARPL